MKRFPPLNKPRVTRFLIRQSAAVGMIALAAVLTDNAAIAVYISRYLPLTVDMLRGMLLIGGIGLIVTPTRNPILVYWLSMPLFIYLIGGVGGATGETFQDWTGVIYLWACVEYILFVWNDA